ACSNCSASLLPGGERVEVRGYSLAINSATRPSSCPLPCEGRGDRALARLHFDSPGGRAQDAIAKNLCAQTTTAFEKFLCAGRECAVHPVAGPAFLHSEKTDALNIEFQSDELVQIDTTRDHIPPSESR